MKFLCLHGKGTSGAIFKSQTAALRSRLSELSIEWDFVDGFHTTDPAPGVDLFYAPPYYSWYENDTVDEIATCRQRLQQYIKANGPYDAVMTFSQGAAVASTFALLQLSEAPDQPLPFKAAIFICAGSPLRIMEQVGYEIAPQVWEKDILTRKALAAQADASAILLQGSSRWNGNHGGARESEEDIRREITPSQTVLSIPTVHVYGARDPRLSAGIQLSQTCDPAKRRTYDHGGGHEIPRTEAVTSSIAALVRWALRAGGVI
ncbi:hypothetical protein ASPACDRAFT_1859066 [Aspergillus aculeatus ATCC 16872]|uniref:Serine hydrolase domain-containing protein n=1 Tax=Aspergillus aculeatus (strain ATCC 16872 / CBS 172.66 / WB 5094) TaxID=690307 RepID=A0A1L9WLG9_ASPA1|nr:uncharacterized protein ASPACDRAFT_1859066 [Aspergillus aculeatus ATCC 16872]OJJ97002.1 hypothetical protein ASPACDRAFT_1859066 [Aspergillus aculeatus ATCC 16872]